jgi:hypothetical protein
MIKNYTVRPYQKDDFLQWNDFISQAKNATFLFHRNFMEYHSDRFDDFSLMVFDNSKLVALVPANRVGDTVFSHQGLTYGGLVLTAKAKLNSVIGIFRSVLSFLNQNGIHKLNLKPIPSFYCESFAEEIDYCLFVLNANLYRKEALSLLNLSQEFSFSKDRKQCIRRGIKANLVIEEEPNFDLFWNEILIPNLEKKHQSKPVHSLEEITKLQQYFPENIRHFNVYHQEKVVAGTTVFVAGNVAHPQYISGNEMKNELGSLDFLYDHLIHQVFADKTYFDFGPSHEDNGRKINEGILFWKESFDTKTVTQSYYEVETQNHYLLDTVLI